MFSRTVRSAAVASWLLAANLVVLTLYLNPEVTLLGEATPRVASQGLAVARLVLVPRGHRHLRGLRVQPAQLPALHPGRLAPGLGRFGGGRGPRSPGPARGRPGHPALPPARPLAFRGLGRPGSPGPRAPRCPCPSILPPRCAASPSSASMAWGRPFSGTGWLVATCRLSRACCGAALPGPWPPSARR